MSDSNGNNNGKNGSQSTKVQMESAHKWRRDLQRHRARREMVEELMLKPYPDKRICQLVSQHFEDSFHAARKDIFKIRQRWLKEDLKESESRRMAALRRIAKKIIQTEESGKWTDNVALERLYGQISGYVGMDKNVYNQTLNIVNVRQVAVIQNQVSNFLDSMPEDDQEQIIARLANARVLLSAGDGAVPALPSAVGKSLPT